MPRPFFIAVLASFKGNNKMTTQPYSVFYKVGRGWLMLAAALLLGGCGSSNPPPKTEAATILPQAKAISAFTLSRGPEKTFDDENLKGRWSLFFFGYTRCPDVCPTELFTLAETLRKIEEKSDTAQEKPQVVFVSVDPQQDQPEAVQKYVSFYHPEFIGVTGEQVAVDKLARSMGAIYERAYFLNGKALIFDPEEGAPEGLENSYLINHSATIFLVNPEGKLHAVFSSPHMSDTIMKDLAAIQQSWG
jgi:protein SCO1/2